MHPSTTVASVTIDMDPVAYGLARGILVGQRQVAVLEAEHARLSGAVDATLAERRQRVFAALCETRRKIRDYQWALILEIGDQIVQAVAPKDVGEDFAGHIGDGDHHGGLLRAG